MRWVIALTVLLVVTMTIVATQPPMRADLTRPPEEKRPTRVASALDALVLAYDDIQNIPLPERLFMRYMQVYSGDIEDAKALSLTINQVSRASIISRPVIIKRNDTVIMRCDLRRYVPRIEDIAEWTRIWEDFQFDPQYNLIITKGTLRFAQILYPTWKGRGFIVETHGGVEVVEKSGKWPGGKDATGTFFPEGVPYTWKEQVRHPPIAGLKEFVLADLKDVELVKIVRPQIFQEWLRLSLLMNTQAPIVTDRYFIYRALSSIQDKGIYATIYGGRYYELDGARQNSKKGTDEDAMFEDVGIGSVEKGITAKELFNRLRSDQRAAKARSNVSGDPRRGLLFPTISSRPDISERILVETEDLRNEDIDIDTDPMANLLESESFAKEVIYDKTNGLHSYRLFNGKGALQREAPPNVVKDHTIPAPHTARLQSGISCISCHEAEGSDGWKAFENDIVKLLKKNRPLDIFGDVTQANELIPDTVDRLAGLYQGNFELPLARGRDRYAEAVRNATGDMEASKATDQADVVKTAAIRQVKLYRDYVYNMVDAKQALLELNVEAKNNHQKILSILLSPDPATARIIPGVGVIIPEDSRLANLRTGIPIGRFSWDLVFALAYERKERNMELVPKALFSSN
jgi:hypothetical protein